MSTINVGLKLNFAKCPGGRTHGQKERYGLVGFEAARAGSRSYRLSYRARSSRSENESCLRNPHCLTTCCEHGDEGHPMQTQGLVSSNSIAFFSDHRKPFQSLITAVASTSAGPQILSEVCGCQGISHCLEDVNLATLKHGPGKLSSWQGKQAVENSEKANSEPRQKLARWYRAKGAAAETQR